MNIPRPKTRKQIQKWLENPERESSLKALIQSSIWLEFKIFNDKVDDDIRKMAYTSQRVKEGYATINDMIFAIERCLTITKDFKELSQIGASFLDIQED